MSRYPRAPRKRKQNRMESVEELVRQVKKHSRPEKRRELLALIGVLAG